MQIHALLPAMIPSDDGRFVELSDVHVRASAAMRVLRDSIPWDGYALTAWDVGSGSHRHVTLASEGYTRELDEHMNDASLMGIRAFICCIPRFRAPFAGWTCRGTGTFRSRRLSQLRDS